MSIANIGLQGQSGWSEGGSSASGWTDAQNWTQGSSYGYGYSHSAEQSSSDWGGYANGESWGQTFGREASAQEVMNAQKANDINMEMWALQALYNAEEAEKNRAYQTYMSNTAYQRATQDLIKAGLNPILAAGAAASSPVGATASAGLSSAAKANAHAESISGSTYNSSNWGSSRSSGYSTSYNENSSKNSSYGYSKGQNSSSSWERSNFTNNVREIANGAVSAISGVISGAKTMLGIGLHDKPKNSPTGGGKSPYITNELQKEVLKKWGY